VRPFHRTTADDRLRQSFGSVEWQTGHWQPIIGMPFEVPVPKKVKCGIAGVGPFPDIARSGRSRAFREYTGFARRRFGANDKQRTGLRSRMNGNFLRLLPFMMRRGCMYDKL